MGKKILIAEDNEINFKLIKTILNQSNINILWAINGEEAVKIYEKNLDICLILMDINMPIMNGVEAAKKIKIINPDVPIIGVTAFYDMIYDETCLDAWVKKPLFKNKLLTVIDEHVKNLCDDIFKKGEKRAQQLINNEKEVLLILMDVSKLLELNDYVSDVKSKEILNTLNDIKNILNKKTNNN